jgi:hypothetical protein
MGSRSLGVSIIFQVQDVDQSPGQTLQEISGFLGEMHMIISAISLSSMTFGKSVLLMETRMKYLSILFLAMPIPIQHMI